MNEPSDELAASTTRTTQEWLEDLRRREVELRQQGHSRSVASEIAQIEDRIAKFWPAAWGGDFQALVYGDFDVPPVALEYPRLGIRILPEKLQGTVIAGHLDVYAARVQVSEKSFSAVMDAAARLNTLLGIWSVVDWGNRSFDWWSHLTHLGSAGVCGPLDDTRVNVAVAALEHLPADVRRKVRSALYWIRESRRPWAQSHRREDFRMFASYWNAFECLVEAVCILAPPPKASRAEKNAEIAAFISKRGNVVDVADVVELHRIVDRGFVGKASHALRVSFPEEADRYIDECFRRVPRTHRLYDIRNAINHGDVDSDNPLEATRVSGRVRQLWMIVFRMLGSFLPYGAPADSGPRDW